MKNHLITVFVIALLLSSFNVYADQFDITSYECEQAKSARDGIRCAVKRIDGMGDTLLIRVHGKASDPDEKRKYTRYNIKRAIHNFIAEGGVFIMMRTTNAKGRIMERTCSRIKGRADYSCHEWHPAEKNSLISFLD